MKQQLRETITWNCRDARESDADAIAALHADSWRRHYRGAYLDSFLDGNVLDDRITVWRERLAESHSKRITVVAESAGELVGFGHAVVDDDFHFGTLLDNLHVEHRHKRLGIGRQLMRAVAQRAIERGSRALYLWVLEQNTAAQAFYAAQGGRCVEQCLRGPFPGGGHAWARRIVWNDASVLM